jgi:hypothetical protein
LIALLKELEQTRRAVQEAKRMFLGANKGDEQESHGTGQYLLHVFYYFIIFIV